MTLIFEVVVTIYCLFNMGKELYLINMLRKHKKDSEKAIRALEREITKQVFVPSTTHH